MNLNLNSEEMNKLEEVAQHARAAFGEIDYHFPPYESLLHELSNGNPGAISVMMLSRREAMKIDPHTPFGQNVGIVLLSKCEVMGSDIFKLYRDVCESDIVKFHAVLRAAQLGIVTKAEIHRAIAGEATLLTGHLHLEVCRYVEGFLKPDAV